MKLTLAKRDASGRPVIRIGGVLNLIAYNRGAKNKTVACGMCRRSWTLSPAMLAARLKRFGMVRCPTCSAELRP